MRFGDADYQILFPLRHLLSDIDTYRRLGGNQAPYQQSSPCVALTIPNIVQIVRRLVVAIKVIV